MRRFGDLGTLSQPFTPSSCRVRETRRPLLPSSRGGMGESRTRATLKCGPPSYGFTVVELVVVLTVIAILTAISVPMGLEWLGTHRFSAMVRAFPNAVLTARMRGIENRQVITISSSSDYSSAPFSSSCPCCCPGIQFVTTADHGLNGPSPALTNNLVCTTTVGCPGTYCSAINNSFCRKNLVSTSTTPGDTVMISGLDKHLSMNGCEFEVLKVPDSTHFVVQHAYSGALGDTPGSDTTGTVRQLTAPGRLRIVPAVGVTTATTNDNQENFRSSDFTIKEEGSSIVFRYDTSKFQATVSNQLLDTTTYLNAQVMFDNRGFPQSMQVVGRDATPVAFSQLSIDLKEIVSTGVKKQGREVLYKISPAGKVETNASF
jgi:prepilin-type N-terminal cleavage/methylation domain-containing protein